jgi:hypothetical protein
MALDKYKLPLCLTEGVEFTLDDAPHVKITVRMPLQINKSYSMGWTGRLAVKDGVPNPTWTEIIKAQEDEFFSSQVIKIVGVKSPDTFWQDYPLAIDEIWKKVQAALPKYQDQLVAEEKKS